MPRLRFSLRAFLLLLFIGSLSASHLYTSWQLDAMRQENAAMRKELGRLTISDPEKINLISVPTHEDMLWRWRIYVPAGRSLRILSINYGIPPQGLPGNYGSSPLPAGEYLMTAAVRRNKEDQWQLRVRLGSATMGQTFPSEHVAWLIDEVGYESMQAGVNGTEVFDPRNPVVLLRVRAMQKIPGGGGSTSTPAPSDGVMIWIKER